MTVIAVCTDGSRCCMAADSQATRNGSVAIVPSKLLRRSGLLFGAAGSMAMGNALRYHLPEIHLEGELHAWAALVLAPWLSSYLRANDLLEKHGEHTEWPGGLLIARGPEWIELDGNGSIMRHVCAWWALGSGGAEARGAMYRAEQMEHAGADEIVRAGVEAACALDDGCRAPIRIEWTS